MAKVKITPAKTETKIVVVVPAEVNLTLTVEEAASLRVLLGHLCLSDMESARNVYRQLSQLFDLQDVASPYTKKETTVVAYKYDLRPLVDSFIG
jgi:hypothetical protein